MLNTNVGIYFQEMQMQNSSSHCRVNQRKKMIIASRCCVGMGANISVQNLHLILVLVFIPSKILNIVWKTLRSSSS